MANHCEPTKPGLNPDKVKKMKERYQKFISEVVNKKITVNMSKKQPSYLKISRDNIETILKDDNFCGLSISFGLKKNSPYSFKITTIVAPLEPVPGTIPATSRIKAGSKPGNSEIDWSSQYVFDDLGQGPSIDILPTFSDKNFSDEEKATATKKFIDGSLALQELVSFVVKNPAFFPEYL